MTPIRFRHLICTIMFLLTITYSCTYSRICNAQNVSLASVPEFTAVFVEDSQPVHITSSNFEIPGSSQLESVTAYITNMYIGDLLKADLSGTSISQSYNQGKLTLSGNDTLENYNKVLHSVTFETNKQNPSSVQRVIDISVKSKTDTKLIATTLINIISINDPPEIADLDLSSEGTGYIAVFKENSGLINITSQNIEIIDIDNTHLYGLTANIVNAQPGDKLQADNTGTSINTSFSDNVLTFSGKDTIENYIKVIKSIKLIYETAETDRIIAITVKDNTRDSKIAISLIVQNINNPIIAHTTTFREGDAPLEIAGVRATLEDPADAGFKELKAILKNPKPGDTLITDVSGTSILSSYDNGTLLLTGDDTKENYEKALRNIKFSNDSQNPDQTQRIIDFSARTKEFSTNIATIILGVIAVNDPPENTIPGSQYIQENTPLFFTSENNPISVSDIDAQNNDIQVSLNVPQGLLNVSENTDLRVSGNNSNKLILKGSISQINTTLDGLRYDPESDWTGSAILTIKTNDLGNTGIHGPLEDTSAVNIIVRSSPDSEKPSAHAGADQTVDEFTLVTLNGTSSYAQNGSIVKYDWVQTQGTDIVLSDADTQHPFFTAPETDENGAVLIFRLTITDSNGQQDSDTISVKVNNKPQTPDPEEINNTYEEGATVTLKAPDNGDRIISYEWRQISGPEVFLSNPRAASPLFAAPVVGAESAILVFELTTKDINNVINTHKIKIKINDNGISGYPENVLTFKTSNNLTMGIRVNKGNLIFIKPVSPDTISEKQNRPSDLIYGLFDIQIQVSEPGKTAEAEIYFQEPANSILSWIKYQLGRWYDYKNNAVFSDDRSMVALTFTDGGDSDDDKIADRFINDLSGLGKPSENADTSDKGGDGDSGGGCFINSVFTKGNQS